MQASFHSFDVFLHFIRQLFREETRDAITAETDLKLLKEWSSLQTMIIVNEIDKEYSVVLDDHDLKQASSVSALFGIIQSRKQ